MPRISGIAVTLYKKEQTGTDAFNHPIYEETAEVVQNVLVGEPSTQEVLDTHELTGKKLAYTLGIPKGDTHDWTDVKVSFFGEMFRTIGAPTQGMEHMIPLDWNKKVKVEWYGG